MWILWPFHLGRFNRVSGRAAGWVGQKGWVAFNRQSWCNNLGFMSIFLGAWTPGWCDWGGPYLWVSVDPGLRFRQTLHMGEVIDGQSLNARKRRWLYQRWEMWCFYPIPSTHHPETIRIPYTMQKPSRSHPQFTREFNHLQWLGGYGWLAQSQFLPGLTLVGEDLARVKSIQKSAALLELFRVGHPIFCWCPIPANINQHQEKNKIQKKTWISSQCHENHQTSTSSHSQNIAPH